MSTQSRYVMPRRYLYFMCFELMLLTVSLVFSLVAIVRSGFSPLTLSWCIPVILGNLTAIWFALSGYRQGAVSYKRFLFVLAFVLLATTSVYSRNTHHPYLITLSTLLFGMVCLLAGHHIDHPRNPLLIRLIIAGECLLLILNIRTYGGWGTPGISDSQALLTSWQFAARMILSLFVGLFYLTWTHRRNR